MNYKLQITQFSCQLALQMVSQGKWYKYKLSQLVCRMLDTDKSFTAPLCTGICTSHQTDLETFTLVLYLIAVVCQAKFLNPVRLQFSSVFDLERKQEREEVHQIYETSIRKQQTGPRLATMIFFLSTFNEKTHRGIYNTAHIVWSCVKLW